jgi:hypothetical protein
MRLVFIIEFLVGSVAVFGQTAIEYNELQTPKLYINGLSKGLPIFVY